MRAILAFALANKKAIKINGAKRLFSTWQHIVLVSVWQMDVVQSPTTTLLFAQVKT